MTADQLVGELGVYAGTFAVAAISSVIPLVSIEVFLVALVWARGPGDAVALVVLAALGQLLGKLPIYAGARGAATLASKRLERVRAWCANRRPVVVLATSAVLGLPPFSLIATAAGVLAIPVRTFCIVVGAGRATRFAALIAITALAARC
jgi:membrane protein YqaA with SNARE-associated domain